MAKMEEIRMVAGPIAQRYFDKIEAERQAAQEKIEAELAAKRAAAEEKKKTEAPEAVNKEEEMTDAEPPKPEEID
jgi:heat shock protein 4